jgi:hypothetical protein
MEEENATEGLTLARFSRRCECARATAGGLDDDDHSRN